MEDSDIRTLVEKTAWFRYLHGLDESGKEMPMLDPNGAETAEARQGSGEGRSPASGHP